MAGLFLASCTERNPDFCGDKTCVDPAKPYCDYYGEIAGMPGTCIAVQCSPGELAVCHEDTAVTCNAEGTNYEQLQCALGCDAAAGGCRQCVKNDQCTGGLVCDTSSSTCRACRADAECDSSVCDIASGVCEPESHVVYASPTGDAGSAAVCTHAQPCVIDRAVSVAASSLNAPIIRMLPGTYGIPLRMNVLNQSIKVVATGATIFVIGDVAAVVVDAGATVDIRGLTSSSERGVQCGKASDTAPISAVSIRDAIFTAPGNTTVFDLQRCNMQVSRVSVTAGGANAGATVLGAGSDTTFDADQFRVATTTDVPNTILAGGSRAHVRLINSILDNTDIVTFFSDSAAPGSSFDLVHVSAFIDDGIELCAGSYPSFVSRSITNSVIGASGTFDALKNAASGQCVFAGTILTHQSGSPSGVTIADPQFVDVAASDFHLKSTSPAIDAALSPSSSDHDFDGHARPQGQAPDSGAYEYGP
jgi:hypothetical protein